MTEPGLPEPGISPPAGAPKKLVFPGIGSPAKFGGGSAPPGVAGATKLAKRSVSAYGMQPLRPQPPIPGATVDDNGIQAPGPEAPVPGSPGTALVKVPLQRALSAKKVGPGALKGPLPAPGGPGKYGPLPKTPGVPARALPIPGAVQAIPEESQPQPPAGEYTHAPVTPTGTTPPSPTFSRPLPPGARPQPPVPGSPHPQQTTPPQQPGAQQPSDSPPIGRPLPPPGTGQRPLPPGGKQPAPPPGQQPQPAPDASNAKGNVASFAASLAKSPLPTPGKRPPSLSRPLSQSLNSIEVQAEERGQDQSPAGLNQSFSRGEMIGVAIVPPARSFPVPPSGGGAGKHPPIPSGAKKFAPPIPGHSQAPAEEPIAAPQPTPAVASPQPTPTQPVATPQFVPQPVAHRLSTPPQGLPPPTPTPPQPSPPQPAAPVETSQPYVPPASPRKPSVGANPVLPRGAIPTLPAAKIPVLPAAAQPTPQPAPQPVAVAPQAPNGAAPGEEDVPPPPDDSDMPPPPPEEDGEQPPADWNQQQPPTGYDPNAGFVDPADSPFSDPNAPAYAAANDNSNPGYGYPQENLDYALPPDDEPVAQPAQPANTYAQPQPTFTGHPVPATPTAAPQQILTPTPPTPNPETSSAYPPPNLPPLPDHLHPRGPPPPLPAGVVHPFASTTPGGGVSAAHEDEKKKKSKFGFGGIGNMFKKDKKDDAANPAGAATAAATGEEGEDAEKKGKFSFGGIKNFAKKATEKVSDLAGKVASGVKSGVAGKGTEEADEDSPIAHMYPAYEQLLEAFTKDDLSLALAFSLVIKRGDVDKQARAWAKIFRYKHRIMDLLDRVISKEIDLTEQEGTLFRNNNFCIGLISQYAQDVARPYLRTLLSPQIDYIMTCGKSFEVQPEKLVDAEKELPANEANLLDLANRYLQAILGSVAAIPPELRRISAILQHFVKPKYPNSVHTVVGGFFFLRLVCPAIVSPEGFGVVDEPIEIEKRRPLILISKTMQQLANEMYFSEDYMMNINSFITENMGVIQDYFDSLANFDINAALPTASAANERPDDESLMRFHQILVKHLPDVKPTLGDKVNALEQMLTSLGEPPDPKILREARREKEKGGDAKAKGGKKDEKKK